MANVKMHIRKGDTVVVLTGKDKGRKGKVLRADADKRRVVVEGVNICKKHQRPTQKVMQGGIVDKELSIDASNVMVLCAKCGKPARIARTVLESGKRVRTCVRCKETMDK